MPSATEFTTSLKLDPQNNTIATLVAMLRRGETECTSERHEPTDLFDQQLEDDVLTTPKPANISAGTGVVIEPKATEVEIEQPTEFEPATDSEPEQPEEPKKPGAFKRFFRAVSDALESLVEEK